MKFDMLQNKTSQLQLQISQGNQIQPPESGAGLAIPEAVQKQIEQKVEDSVRQMVNYHFLVIWPKVKVRVRFHHSISEMAMHQKDLD